MNSKENEILSIFCRAEKPLSLTDLKSLHPELNKNTLAHVLSTLKAKGLIDVVDYGMSNKTICRLYAPTTLAKEQILNQFTKSIDTIKGICSKVDICMAILNTGINKEIDTQEMTRLRNILNAHLDKNTKDTERNPKDDKHIIPDFDGHAD